MRMRPTKLPTRSPRSARNTPVAFCSLSACGRSDPKAAANPGERTAARRTSCEAKSISTRKTKPMLTAVQTVEVNPHGTSQYCSRCGAKGERFSFRGTSRSVVKWGKLFGCPVCHYQANADHNASVNMHRSFYHEMHWEWRDKRRADPAPSG